MEKDYSVAEKQINIGNKIKQKRNLDARKSLDNYINQLKIHFDLNEEDTIEIIKAAFEARAHNNGLLKKWWQIWR